MPREKKVCDNCDGRGGFEYQSGYNVTGTGFGDASPRYKSEKCNVCDGRGYIYVGRTE